LAVTKKVRPEVAAALGALGQTDLGESRVPDLENKRAWLAEHETAARWHLIGHLQRNKARRAVQAADVIHSVDSLRLLEALERVAGEEGRAPRVYLEVKLAGSEARTAMAPEDLRATAARAAELEHVVPVGLMTMAPPPAGVDAERDEREARAVFGRLRELRDELAPEWADAFEGERIELSMGMSSDLEAAVLEGTDVVRVGTALYAGTEAQSS
jgi:hypothetical protein